MYIIGDKDKERTKTIKAIAIIRRGELTPFELSPEDKKTLEAIASLRSQ